MYKFVYFGVDSYLAFDLKLVFFSAVLSGTYKINVGEYFPCLIAPLFSYLFFV